MKTHFSHIFVSLVLLTSSSTAFSAIVNYSFTGVITDLDASLTSTFSIGAELKGAFSVESDNPTIQSTRTIYSVPTINVSIGDNYTMTALNGSMIISSSGFSSPVTASFSVSSSSQSVISGEPVNGQIPGYFGIQLDWFNVPSPFISESLPDYVPLNAQEFDFLSNTGLLDRSNINFPDDYVRLSYTVTSIQAVPVPAAVWLFGTGVLGLVGSAKRKKA